ncbi:MAG: FKBP-type peptidyl-prolyl cis-trans isomerase [Planctomycetota bacterium]
MFRIRFALTAFALLLLGGPLAAMAQPPGFAPSTVQNQDDPKTLTEKASRMVGFNMIQSILKQGGQPDIDDMEKGMQSAASGEDQSSFIAGYNIAMQLKSNGGIDVEKMMAGVKAAQDGQDKKSYISGFQLMQNMEKSEANLSMDKIVEGMRAALSGGELGMTQEEGQAVMSAFGKLVQERQMAKMKLKSEENLAAAKAYMDKNKAENPNVKEMANGVQYEVIQEGTGVSPGDNDRVKVDYHGTFINGEVFDSTTAPTSGLPPQPATFNIGEVVPGFRAALSAMKVGSKWKIVIPGPLAYGAQGRGKIGPNQALRFEVTLLDVIKN